MNGSKGSRSCRALALMATLFGAMVTALPAFGQQEVDPTWYNPWAAPSTVVVHSSPSRVAVHRHQGKVKSVSSARVAGKVRGNKTTTRPRSS